MGCKQQLLPSLKHSTSSAVCPAPYACAQPYQPGSGKGSGNHTLFFALLGAQQHGITVRDVLKCGKQSIDWEKRTEAVAEKSVLYSPRQ